MEVISQSVGQIGVGASRAAAAARLRQPRVTEPCAWNSSQDEAAQDPGLVLGSRRAEQQQQSSWQ